MTKHYSQVYEEFWKELVENPDGTLNKEQVMKELADFSFIIGSVTKVYCHLSNSRMSNPMILPEVVLSVIEDVQNEHTNDCIKETLEEVLEIIDDQIEGCKRTLDEITDKNCMGAGWEAGAIHELQYLSEQINEKYLT